MKYMSACIGILLLCTAVNAQQVITRTSGGVDHFYYDGFTQAVLDDALPGDTIILGGGTYEVATDLVINVPIVLIGTGTRPDSTLAYGGPTSLALSFNKQLFIASTADGTEMHGISTVGAGAVKMLAPYDADNCLFKRCDLAKLTLGYNGSLADNTRIEECIIEFLEVNAAPYTTIRNCIIRSLKFAYAASHTQVWNSILLGMPTMNDQVHYENCIFVTNSQVTLVVVESSTYVNNLFVGIGAGFNVEFGYDSTDGGNLPAEGILSGVDGAFVNVTSILAHDYASDYHVSPPYATSGSDGTPIGLYGGENPWKEGGLPFNPHWQQLTGPDNTTNGTMQNVILRGSAQTH